MRIGARPDDEPRRGIGSPGHRADGRCYIGRQPMSAGGSERPPDSRLPISRYGVGTDWNSELLTYIAETTKGRGRTIESAPNLAAELAGEFRDLQDTALTGAEIIVAPSDGVGVASLHRVIPDVVGYPIGSAGGADPRRGHLEGPRHCTEVPPGACAAAPARWRRPGRPRVAQVQGGWFGRDWRDRPDECRGHLHVGSERGLPGRSRDQAPDRPSCGKRDGRQGDAGGERGRHGEGHNPVDQRPRRDHSDSVRPQVTTKLDDGHRPAGGRREDLAGHKDDDRLRRAEDD